MKRRHKTKSRNFYLPQPKVVILSLKNFGWIFLLLAVILSLTGIYAGGIFRIKKTLCLHEERPCHPAVEAELNQLMGKNILTFRTDQLEDKLMGSNLAISDVDISVSLPHTIKVTLKNTNLNLTLATAPTANQAVFVDKNLVPFKVDSLTDTTATIITDRLNNLTLGEQIIDPIILSSIELSSQLYDHFVAFKYIQIFEDRLQVVLKNDGLALFGFEDNYLKTVPSLQLILSQATIQEKPREIDLRFRNPVLRF